MLTPKRKPLKPGEKVALSLTLAQVDLIVENTLLGEGLLSTIHAARVQGNTVRARCTLGDLEELAGCVAAKAKASQDRAFQKELGNISEAISKVARAYYYDFSPSGTSRGMKLVHIEHA